MDAADILGAPREGGEFKARVRNRDKPPDIAAAKLKGLSREIYHLTGQTLEASTPVAPAQAFGKKRATLQRKVHWEFAGFSNSARTDGLMLRHWQKKGVKWEDYPFARFNKKVQLLKYDDNEYEKLLHSEHWTRKQTDALMQLVQRFHLNFVLVQDRWEGEETQGSVDALKERFYEIQRKLYLSREDLPPLPEDNPLLTKPFNRLWEEERKQLMHAAAQRSKEEDKVGLEILEKARKIEAALKRKRTAEKSSSRSRDKGGQPDSRPLLPAGGVVLRSSLTARAAKEVNNQEAILDAIGFQLPVMPQHAAVCEAVNALIQDVNSLLSWYQRFQALRESKSGKSSAASGSKAGGGGGGTSSSGGGGGAGSTSSPRPEGEEKSAKKARKI